MSGLISLSFQHERGCGRSSAVRKLFRGCEEIRGGQLEIVRPALKFNFNSEDHVLSNSVQGLLQVTDEVIHVFQP